MPRKPHPFTALGLKRTLSKFSVRDKREVIRKYLFGKNAYRYPVGSKGEEFNEYELDQIIVFLASTSIDDYVPSTFSKSSQRAKRKQSVRADKPAESVGHFQLDDGGSGTTKGWRGVLEGPLDVDAVLNELADHIQRGGEGEDSDDDGDGS